MPKLRIEDVIWDDRNLGHATVRATVAEIEQVLSNVSTVVRNNKKMRTGNFLAQGRTSGGRRLTVAFVYDPTNHSARPITAWEG